MDSNTKAPLIWGAQTLNPGDWHLLDQLWFCLKPAQAEAVISYCYSEFTHGNYQQFSALHELRVAGSEQLTAHPGVSDKAIVARPVQAIHLPGDSAIKLYVGTPLWFILRYRAEIILDVPVARLSDSWFGPNTQLGEVCYASKTHARLSLDGIEPNPFKAITPVTVRNRTNKPMIIDKINIPVQHLSLYQGDHRYWTSGIRLSSNEKASDSEVKISSNPPEASQNPLLLAPPRQPLSDGILRKTLDFLLG